MPMKFRKRIGIATMTIPSTIASGITYLSEVGGTPTAAYSVRKVVSSYSGPAMLVRNSSGGLLDIGFIGENLDTASLLSHAAGGDVTVNVWYDQSGGGYHATQATALSQPKIVSNGSLVTENGKVALDFDSRYLSIDPSFSTQFEPSNQSLSAFAVIKNSDLGLSQYIFHLTDNTNSTAANNDYIIFTLSLTNSYTSIIVRDFIPPATYNTKLATSDPNSTSTNQALMSAIRSGASSTAYADGNAGTTADTSLPALNLYWASIGALVRGTVPDVITSNFEAQELIIYASDKSSLRTAIEGNINAYFNIYS